MEKGVLQADTMASGLEGAFASADDVADAVESRIRAGGPPPSKRRKRADATAAMTVHAGGIELADVAAVFRDHPVHQQAFAAYHSSVLKHPLTWAKRTGPGPEDFKWPPVSFAKKTPTVPDWCRRFVADAVESFLIAGWFAWAHDPKGERATVIPPEQVVLTCSPTAPEWKIDPASPGALMWAKGKLARLNLVIINPPSQHGCRSGARRAAKDTARYDAMEHNFDLRDRHNSKPAIYTTVSQDLKNQNGSTRQWFRAANAADVAGSRASSIDTNFNDLIARRADTVRKLHDITVAERERLSSGAGAAVGVGAGAAAAAAALGTDDDDPAGEQHTELIVTDGKDYTQLHMLQSMTDGKTELDRLYTNIMIAFGVPPQVFGKNVNTERHAASNRLTESAVDMFHHTTSLLRARLSAALNEACEVPHGKFVVTFKPFLDKADIDKLAPILDTGFAALAIASAYNIPEKYINKDKIEAINLFDHARIRAFQGSEGKARITPPGGDTNPPGAKAATVATND